MRRRRIAPRANERGSAAVEIVLVTPVFLAFLGALVVGGQLILVEQRVGDAARGAVEAAAEQTTPVEAGDIARSVATSDLSTGSGCSNHETSISTAHFSPGGSISVTVTCTVELYFRGFAGIPSDLDVSASRSAPLEPYRTIAP